MNNMNELHRQHQEELDERSGVNAKQSRINRPSINDLEYWMDEGGCEAACEEACWIEHDGYCEHGKPSWFIKLGLI